MNNTEFNILFRKRTLNLSLSVLKFYAGLKKIDEVRIMGKQLIRCTTSVGANFRAACVARSSNEKYSKYCIVVEEADEMLYWLDLFNKCHLNITVPSKILSEAAEIVKVMTACKIGLGKRIAHSKKHK